MTSTADPVWLFDLDGTLLEVNSFPLWVSQILIGELPHLTFAARLSLSLRCAAAIAERKVLRQSHVRFKRRLQRLWTHAVVHASPAPDPSAHVCAPFIERLLAHVRPSFEPLLGEVARGRIDAVLTTAAAAEYAVPLARRLGFRHVIATPPGGRDGEPDNVGEAKRDRTLAYLAARDWVNRPRVFFTDHCDDLPLIRVCESLVWLGGDDEFGKVCSERREQGALCARTLTSDAVYRWVVDRPRARSGACT
jgi:phosphoserine phosphatase